MTDNVQAQRGKVSGVGEVITVAQKEAAKRLEESKGKPEEEGKKADKAEDT